MDNSAEVRLESLKLLALGPNDGRVVIQFPDKKMLVLHVGETVPGTHAVLTEVLTDKAVFDEAAAPSQGKQAVWMWKGSANAPGRIQRFASSSQQNVSQHAPAEKFVALPANAGDGAPSNSEKKQ